MTGKWGGGGGEFGGVVAGLRDGGEGDFGGMQNKVLLIWDYMHLQTRKLEVLIKNGSRYFSLFWKLELRIG